MKVKKKKIIYDDLEKSSQWSKILQKVIIVRKKTREPKQYLGQKCLRNFSTNDKKKWSYNYRSI